jgi:hypothetical protein
VDAEYGMGVKAVFLDKVGVPALVRFFSNSGAVDDWLSVKAAP